MRSSHGSRRLNQNISATFNCWRSLSFYCNRQASRIIFSSGPADSRSFIHIILHWLPPGSFPMQPTHILPDLVDEMTESHLRRNPLCFDATIVSSLCAYLGGTRRRATRMFGLAGHFYDDICAHGPRPSRRHNRIGAYLRVFVRIPHLNSQTWDGVMTSLSFIELSSPVCPHHLPARPNT